MTTYSTTVQVKAKMANIIPASGSTYDALIDDYRDRYYDDINTRLRPFTTVPLTVASEDYYIVVEIEALLCAGALVLEKVFSVSDDSKNKARMLIDRAYELLAAYIKNHFQTSTQRASLLYHYRGGSSFDSSDIDEN